MHGFSLILCVAAQRGQAGGSCPRTPGDICAKMKGKPPVGAVPVGAVLAGFGSVAGKEAVMSRVFVPSRGAEDWRRLLAQPGRQWRPGRSAMAAARSWEAAGGLPPEIATLLGGAPELLLALPEHRVALPGGARASQCDVFALLRLEGETMALAVEAKVDEPFGPTLAAWSAAGGAGRAERLRHICGLLGLSEPPPGALRYQLLHRSAAAVVEAGRFGTDRAAMVVQSFSAQHRWFGDFAAFLGLFGVAAAPGQAATVRLPSRLPLTLGWAVGAPGLL